MYGPADFTGTLQRLSIGLAVKPVSPDKIRACKKREKEGVSRRKEGRGGQVPPALISQKPDLTLSVRHMHKPYNVPPDGSTYGGRPRPGPTSPPTNQQQSSVARRVAGHNSAQSQLLCGTFSSPCSPLGYFCGG